jgi:hypothetical protein
MKIKCENVIVCGNYNCAWNCCGSCGQNVVAMDANGKCALEKPKDRPTQNKPNKPYDVETSK